MVRHAPISATDLTPRRRTAALVSKNYVHTERKRTSFELNTATFMLKVEGSWEKGQ